MAGLDRPELYILISRTRNWNFKFSARPKSLNSTDIPKSRVQKSCEFHKSWHRDFLRYLKTFLTGHFETRSFTIHINLFKFTTVGLQDRFNIWLVDGFSASVWLPIVSRHDNKYELCCDFSVHLYFHHIRRSSHF